MSLTLCWQNTGQANEIIYVPSGYVVGEDGYFMPEQAGREVLTAWKTDREQKIYYKEQLELALDRQAEMVTQLLEKVNNLETQTKALIADKDKQIRVERAKAHRPGVGIFAGVGMSTDGDINAVVGIGLVWKIF